MIESKGARVDAAIVPATLDRILDDLLSHGVACAPHVAARLAALLAEDVISVRQTAGLLDASQRHGLRPLPHPLPLAPAVESRYRGVVLEPLEQRALLSAALGLDDRLGPLADAVGIGTLATSEALTEALTVHAGRVGFADPRLAVWILRTSSSATVVAVHRQLSGVHAERGDRLAAHWHRARSSHDGDPQTAAELTRSARLLAEAGLTEEGLMLAAEAAAHSHGAERDEARLVAGTTAIAGGYATEAARWLSMLFPGGEVRYRLQGLGGLLVAQAHLQGSVPEVLSAAFRPRGDDPGDWYSWARAAAFASVLCAASGDRTAMRAWIDALREGASRAGAESELRDPVIPLAWLLAGDREVDDVSEAGSFIGSVFGALRAAMDGRADRGLRLLAAADPVVAGRTDHFIAGFEHSPLIAAHVAVVEALLLTWRGDIAAARERLLDAAARLPVALPFAGLGVVLARRLDLAVLGRIGPVARSLASSLPTAIRVDQLVDRGIQAHLSGASGEADEYMRIWMDRGEPEPVLSVPGLDECAPADIETESARHRVEPADMTLARRLRRRIARTTDAEWVAERSELVDDTRRVGSPFERARVESVLAERALVGDDITRARRHLETARGLFDESGALAWAAAATERLRRLDAELVSVSGPETSAAAHRGWQRILTGREVEVAMHVLHGASNKEIAGMLQVSVRTVEVHLGRVFAKLGVRTRVELVLLGHRLARRG